ncbi:MAG: hypothetical protein K0B07_00180 [DPANN group archaeon]|nr:hypothetical protein [DPANN group archaeon]
MSVKASDYSIEYSLVDGMPTHNIFIRLNDTFADYLKNSYYPNNKDKYDEIALNAMKINNCSEDNIDIIENKSVCNWEGGVLDNIMFPVGSAVSLVIEYNTDFGTIYRSHNVDNISKMSVLMTVITNYLSNMSMSFEHFKSGERGNYKIWYNINDKTPYHDISVEISDDFLESLKYLDVNKKYYDKIAIDAMKICGVDKIFIDAAEVTEVCDWDDGLLKHIILPYRDATELVLEFDTPYGNVYKSHNVNGYVQMAVLMTVITNYFSDMDLILSRDF